MAATSKQAKKNSGSTKKRNNAKSATAESARGAMQSSTYDEAFTRFIYSLVSFQQVAFWYYANGREGTPMIRAEEIMKDIMRLEKKYVRKGDQGIVAGGRCPSGWVDCGGLCLEPGSLCP